MYKKIIYMFIGLSMFVFGQQKDVTDGLLVNTGVEGIVINQLAYPGDLVCERKFIDRFISANEKLIKRIENEPEDLDFCRPLTKLFHLNQRASKIELMDQGKRKDFEIRDISLKYQQLVKTYKKSYYIHLYAKLFSKKYELPIKQINKDLFKYDNSDYSDYMRKLYIGLDKENKEEYVKYRKMDRKEVRYKNVKTLVQSRFNLIYINASSDVFEYLKVFEKDKLREFVEYEMIEHKKRGLELNRIYLDYSILILEENKRDFLESEKWVLNSYQEGQLYEQTVQLMRIRAVKMFFDIKENYPKYLGDREEVDYINKRLDNIKIQEIYLKRTSQEMFYNRGFLNIKLSEIFYREKKKRRNYLDFASKDYQAALKYGNYDDYERERILDILDDIYKDLSKLKNKKRGDRDEE